MFLAHKAIIHYLPLSNMVKFDLTSIPQEGISRASFGKSLFSVFMDINNCPWDADWLWNLDVCRSDFAPKSLFFN